MFKDDFSDPASIWWWSYREHLKKDSHWQAGRENARVKVNAIEVLASVRVQLGGVLITGYTVPAEATIYLILCWCWKAIKNERLGPCFSGQAVEIHYSWLLYQSSKHTWEHGALCPFLIIHFFKLMNYPFYFLLWKLKNWKLPHGDP